METGRIRMATQADAPALLAIYAPYVVDTPITFEYAPPSWEEFCRRMEKVMAEYPYLVWESAGEILGYAYAGKNRERAAYQWGAELSVYIKRGAQGRGMGRVLYTVLMELLRLQNIKTVYGAVTVPNPASQGLHTALGFASVGVFRKTGYKQGAWLDVEWYEKMIGSFEEAPSGIIPIGQVPQQAIEEVLQAAIDG